MTATDTARAIDAVWRIESAKLIAGLTRPTDGVLLCDGREVSTGASGEIVLRGPNVMAGYLDDARATEETLRGGWLHTGDTGYVDADGYYYLPARG